MLMHDSSEQPGSDLSLGDVESGVLNRLDRMEARLISEFQKMTSPTQTKSKLLDERLETLPQTLKASQTEREAEQAMWDVRQDGREACQAELDKQLDDLEQLNKLSQARWGRRRTAKSLPNEPPRLGRKYGSPPYRYGVVISRCA